MTPSDDDNPAAADGEIDDPLDHVSARAPASAFSSSAFSVKVLATGIGLAGRKPAHDLDVVVVLAAGAHLPRFKAVVVAHEQRRLAFDGLQRLARHDHLRGVVAERDLCGDEGAGLPAVVGIGEAGNHARVARLAIEQRADENDLRARFPLDADGADADGCALAHRGDVFGRDRKIDPDVVEIDDDEELALLALAPDEPAEIDAALGDAARDRRAQILLAQAFRRLVRQVGDLAFRQAQREQFLPRAVELDLSFVGGELGAEVFVLGNRAGFDQRFLPR